MPARDDVDSTAIVRDVFRRYPATVSLAERGLTLGSRIRESGR